MSTRMRRARGSGKGYEKISRDVLQDKTLTLKARGLIAMLASLPDDWECSGVEGIAKQFCDHDGYTAVNAAIKELEAHGLFARLKRQGVGGKWDWLWTYSDDATEVAQDVKAWSDQGYRCAGRSGPKDAKTPRQREEEQAQGAMSRNPQHGEEAPTMLVQPVDGSPVDGQPQNKEMHFPPTEGSATGEIYTHAASGAAAEPPVCVPDLFEAAPISDPAPVDPDDAAANWTGRRPRRSSRSVANWNKMAHSPEAAALMARYCEGNPMPRETREQLLPVVTSLLSQDMPEWAILEAIPECFRAGCGPKPLPTFVAQVMARRQAPAQAQSTTGKRLMEAEGLRERMRARDAAEAAQLASAPQPRAINGGAR